MSFSSPFVASANDAPAIEKQPLVKLVRSDRRTAMPTRAPFLKTRFGGYHHRDVPDEDADTHPCRPRHARRRIPAPLLAAGLLLRRTQDLPHAGPDPRRGTRRVPRPQRHGGPAGVALSASRHIAGIWADRCERDTLLLSRLAVRRRTATILETPGEPADSTLKDRLCHGAYPTREEHGIVFAYLGPPEQQPPFPVYDSFVRPGYQLIPGKKYFYPCNWLQIMENAMDPAHTAFLHTIVSGAVSPTSSACCRNWNSSRPRSA